MAFGITDDGFVAKTQNDILDELDTYQKANIDSALNTSAGSVLGQLNAIFSDQVREAWELIEGVYNGFYPDTASGAQLDQVAALTGTTRQAATKSTVTLTLTLDAGVTVPAGSVVSVDGNSSARFVTLANATNGGGVPADIDADAEAETAGPVTGYQYTITEIETPVAGWTAVINNESAAIGSNIETDAALRARREDEIRLPGSSTIETIRAALLAVTDVKDARVFENTSLVTNPSGVPGKAFECVVQDGDDQDIVDAIFLRKPVGIETYGTDSGTYTDTQGINHTIEFSRPSDLTVYLEIDIAVDSDVYAGTAGDTAIKEALTAYIQTLDIGEDLILSRLYAHIFSVPGVTDVSSILADTVSPPVASSNIVTTNRQLIVSDTNLITVNR